MDELSRFKIKGMPERPKVLIIRLRMIGDVLLDTPLVRALHKRGFEVHYLTGRMASAILAYNKRVKKLYVREEQRFVYLLHSVRENGYHAVFDFMHNLWSMALTGLSGARIRAAIAKRKLEFPYNFRVMPPYKEKPYTVYHRLEFLRALGYDPDEASPEIEFPFPERVIQEMRKRMEVMGIDENEFLVAVNAAPESPVRNWPLERFLEISRVLVEEFDARVLFLWTPEKKRVLEDAINRFGMANISLSPPTETLFHLGALLRLVALFFGVDSGPRHIAISQGTPTFALFTHASPLGWTPPQSSDHGYVWKGLACQPCERARCPFGTYDCVRSLTVAEVKEAFIRFLEGHLWG